MPAAEPTHNANNFDFLRLIAAVVVIFSHSWLIAYGTQHDEPLVWATHNQCPLGLVGVFVFFVISGYLVTESYCRRPKPGGFVLRRFMRIYPALIPNGLLCALVLGPIVTSLPLAAYSADAEKLSLDGQEVPGTTLLLRDDRQEHAVELRVRGTA